MLTPEQLDDLRQAQIDECYDSMPKSVRVGNMVYRIEISEVGDSIAQREFGHCNFLAQKIRISPTMQSCANIANTVLHESLHAIHFFFGLGDESDEEEFTNLGTNGLCSFFADNPEATTWILKYISETQ